MKEMREIIEPIATELRELSQMPVSIFYGDCPHGDAQIGTITFTNAKGEKETVIRIAYGESAWTTNVETDNATEARVDACGRLCSTERCLGKVFR